MNKIITAVIVAVLSLGVADLDAKDKDKGKKNKGGGKDAVKAVEKAAKGKKLKPKEKAALEKHHGYFDVHERGVLREQFRGYDRSRLPPGLAKKNLRYDELPPGWQKKLSRGSAVPHDMFGYFHPLPPDIRHRMPPLGDGYDYRIFDERVFKMRLDTRTIIDVIAYGDLY
ncbi:hypothetical protein BH23VER1_BH23VER1_04820 [soil metagenome]